MVTSKGDEKFSGTDIRCLDRVIQRYFEITKIS